MIELLVYQDFTCIQNKIGKYRIYTDFTVNLLFCPLLSHNIENNFANGLSRKTLLMC